MVMRASVQTRVAPAEDAAAAPITIRRRREAPLGGFLLAIAGLWIAVPLRRLLDTSAAVPDLGAPGTIAAVLIGAALALLAVSWIVRCQVLVIDQGLVRMTDQRLSGNRVWEESLARYHGVRQRREQRPHHDGSRSWYIIEAWHPEPAKTVELARTKDPRLIERGAQLWARRLALPLCHEPASERPPDRTSGREIRSPAPVAPTGSVVGASPASLVMAHGQQLIPLQTLQARDKAIGRWPVPYAIMFITGVTAALWAIIIVVPSWLIG
jgi:hypothetical protein